MAEVAFLVNGTQVSVDLDAELGDLTPAETRIAAGYVAKADMDRDRAWAGAHILVKLSRAVDMDPDDLLEAVLDAA